MELHRQGATHGYLPDQQATEFVKNNQPATAKGNHSKHPESIFWM
ncbi:hypothetical protein [Spirosoma aerolatum]|nr:hypothetical protein [Spirosoma aerolatum]